MKLRKAVLLMLLGGCLFTPTFAASKQITLSVLYVYDSEGHKACIKQLLEQYEKLHPHIKLNVQVTTTLKWQEIIRMRAIANDFPDITTCVQQRVGEWAVTGKLAAGNQYIPKNVLNKYNKKRLLSVTYNGRIYGLPFANSTRGVAYNVDYFTKAGIKPPQKAKDAWTWEQLVAAAKKAQAASGAKYALQFERPTFDGWLAFIYQAGGQLMSDDYTKPMLNTPQVRKALEWTVKLHRDGIAAPGIIEGIEDGTRMFTTGMTTMWLAVGTWMIDAIDSLMEKYEYSYTFMPIDKQAATVVGGMDWIVFKGAHPKEAWDLLLYMVSPGPMASINEVANSVPPRNDVHVTWRLHPELAQFFAEQAKECPETLLKQEIHPAYTACRDKLLQELSMCISGQKSVAATLTAMNRIMGKALKQYHY